MDVLIMSSPRPWQGQTHKVQDRQSDYVMRLSTLRQALLQQEAIHFSQGIERLHTQSNQRYGRAPVRIRKEIDAESAPEIHKRKQLERMRRIESFRNRKEHILVGTLEGRTLFEQTQLAVFCGKVMREKARCRHEKEKRSSHANDAPNLPEDTPEAGDSDESPNDTSGGVPGETQVDIISSIERKLGEDELHNERHSPIGLSKKAPVMLQNISAKSMFNFYRRFQTGELRRLICNGYSPPVRGQCQSPVMTMIEDLQGQVQGYDANKSLSSSITTDEESGSPRTPMKGVRRQKLARTLTCQAIEASPLLKIDKLDVAKEPEGPVRPTDTTMPSQETPPSPPGTPIIGKKPINVKVLERKPSLTARNKFSRVREVKAGPPTIAIAAPDHSAGFVKPLRRVQSLSIYQGSDVRRTFGLGHGAGPKAGSGSIPQDRLGATTTTTTVADVIRPRDHRAAIHRSQTSTGIAVPRMLNIEIPYGGNALQDREDTMSQGSSELPVLRGTMNITL